MVEAHEADYFDGSGFVQEVERDFLRRLAAAGAVDGTESACVPDLLADDFMIFSGMRFSPFLFFVIKAVPKQENSGVCSKISAFSTPVLLVLVFYTECKHSIAEDCKAGKGLKIGFLSYNLHKIRI
jgi:hypothetical protein